MAGAAISMQLGTMAAVCSHCVAKTVHACISCSAWVCSCFCEERCYSHSLCMAAVQLQLPVRR